MPLPLLRIGHHWKFGVAAFDKWKVFEVFGESGVIESSTIVLKLKKKIRV